MDLKLDINTSMRRFEAWLSDSTRKTLPFIQPIDQEKWWTVVGGPLRQDMVGARMILRIEASLSRRSPTDPNDSKTDQLPLPVIEFEIVEPASERIRVKAVCRPIELQPYFIRLLDEIADLWPETQEAILEYKLAALAPEQREQLINSVVSKIEQERPAEASVGDWRAFVKAMWDTERRILQASIQMLDIQVREQRSKSVNLISSNGDDVKSYVLSIADGQQAELVTARIDANRTQVTLYPPEGSQADDPKLLDLIDFIGGAFHRATIHSTEASSTESGTRDRQRVGNEQQGKAVLPDSIKPPKGKKREQWLKAYAIICETRVKYQEAYDNLETDTPLPNVSDYRDALKANGLSYSDRVITAIMNWGDAGRLNAT